MTFEQWFHNLYLFSASEGYDLSQLFADQDYKTIEMLADKMKEKIIRCYGYF